MKQLGFSGLVFSFPARQVMQVIENDRSRKFATSKARIALAAAHPGHGPFSHAFEQVGRRLGLKLADHKYVSDLLIRDSEVSGASKGGGGKGKVRPLPDDLTRIQS